MSIGIAHNILLARLATRRAKPAGSYHLLPADVPSFLAPLDIRDLWGFGWSTQKKAEEKLGTTTLGELAKKSKSMLCDALGKGTGETLYKAIRGIDEKKLESDKPRKSVSSEITVRFSFPCSPCGTCSDGTSLKNSMVSGLIITPKPRNSCSRWHRKFQNG